MAVAARSGKKRLRSLLQGINVRKYIEARGGLFARGSIDPIFFTLLVALVVVGLAMLYSATYVYAYYYENSSTYYLKKQLFAVVLGFILMFAVSHINYRILTHVAAVAGTLVSWVLIGIALLMPDYNGTRRYIYGVPIVGQFQPSDVAKFALILTLAAILGENHDKIASKKPLQGRLAKLVNRICRRPVINESFLVIVPAGIILLVYAGLVALQSHLSGTVLMLLIGIVLLVLSEARWGWFALGGVGGGAAVFAAAKLGLLKSYMQERVTAWLDKDYDPYGKRWQINNALNAVGSGGFFGKGFSRSTMKHLYVSEPQNDMIFSIVVEELGVFGAACIILLFVLMIWRGVSIAIKSRDRYGALVVMGVVFQVGLQMILNILVATDSLPNTGISLPFFSYGGTAILVLLVEMGVVLSVSRTANVRKRL